MSNLSKKTSPKFLENFLHSISQRRRGPDWSANALDFEITKSSLTISMYSSYLLFSKSSKILSIMHEPCWAPWKCVNSQTGRWEVHAQQLFAKLSPSISKPFFSNFELLFSDQGIGAVILACSNAASHQGHHARFTQISQALSELPTVSGGWSGLVQTMRRTGPITYRINKKQQESHDITCFHALHRCLWHLTCLEPQCFQIIGQPQELCRSSWLYHPMRKARQTEAPMLRLHERPMNIPFVTLQQTIFFKCQLWAHVCQIHLSARLS